METWIVLKERHRGELIANSCRRHGADMEPTAESTIQRSKD